MYEWERITQGRERLLTAHSEAIVSAEGAWAVVAHDLENLTARTVASGHGVSMDVAKDLAVDQVKRHLLGMIEATA